MITIFSLIISIILIISFCKSEKIEYTDIVHTDKGSVRGVLLQTVQLKQEYSAFKGIPYANPPVGYGRRFRRPVPADPWDDVLYTVKDPSPCAQRSLLRMTDYSIGQEDCLYLNVYTPELNFTSPGSRAVMVWIHGGAFQFGSIDSSEFGPDFLIEKDVVIMAMNYRLDVFGFLSFLPKYFDGNNGLRDQVAALRWVQRNIAKFGGDKKKVTIFGESAGGASVEFHKLSPLSRGLFRASIAMSGSALNSWAFQNGQVSKRHGWSLVNRMVDWWFNYTDLYEKMADISKDDLLRASFHTIFWSLDLIPFKPTLESKKLVNRPYLSEFPTKLYKTRKFVDKPHILGYMRNETLIFVSLFPILNILGGAVISDLVTKSTEYNFIKDIDRTQRYLTYYGNAPIYYYQNSFDYNRSLHKMIGENYMNGSGHADDVAHIFWVQTKGQPLDSNSDIGRHRQKMVTMWTNFAKYLIPVLPKDKAVVGVNWEVSGRKGLHLEMDKSFSIGGRPTCTRLQNMIQYHYDLT